MNSKGLSFLIRVKGQHFMEIPAMVNREQVSKILIKSGFVLVETSGDGFIETYEHPENSNPSLNTWISFSEGLGDTMMVEVQTTVA